MKLSYYSGSTINVLGSRSDMMTFFDVINKFVVPRRSDVDLSIITDRLYRRYIKQDQADHAEQIMRLIEQEFAQIKPNELIWKKICIDPKQSALNLETESLAETFSKYFSKFYESLEEPDYFFKHGHKYNPLRITYSDYLALFIDKKRPLDAYDRLEGPPFWLEEPPPARPAPSYKDGKEVPHGTPGSTRPDYMSEDGTTAVYVYTLDDPETSS